MAKAARADYLPSDDGPNEIRRKIGAVEKTRTSTRFPPQAPQACASTIPPRPHRAEGGDIADEHASINDRTCATHPCRRRMADQRRVDRLSRGVGRDGAACC